MSKLSLVPGGKVDLESLSETERAVQRVMDTISQIANGVDSMGRRGLALSTESFPCKDFDIEGVKDRLKDECVVYGVVENDGRGNLATTIQPESFKKFRAAKPTAKAIQFDLQILIKKTFSRAGESASWDFICSGVNDVPPFLYQIVPGDEVYYFYSPDLKDHNPYLGKRFYEIEEELAAIHGPNSEVVKNIQQVVELYHSLLYVKLAPKANSIAINRLRELILKVGDAARAIIKDFDRDAHDNEGWETID